MEFQKHIENIDLHVLNPQNDGICINLQANVMVLIFTSKASFLKNTKEHFLFSNGQPYTNFHPELL